MKTCSNPNYRMLQRGHDQIILFLSRPVCRIPPLVGTAQQMFWIDWQGFLPDDRSPFRWGVALSPEGAERKVWKAYDEFMETRRRWSGDPQDLALIEREKLDVAFTDDALRRPFHPHFTLRIR